MHPSMYSDKSELFEWDPSCLLHREIGVHALLDRYLCGWKNMKRVNFYVLWKRELNIPEVLDQLQ